MDWKDIIIIIIIIAGVLAGIFAPKISAPIIRWIEKKGILKSGTEDKTGLKKKG